MPCLGGEGHKQAMTKMISAHPREHGHRYTVEHQGDYLYVITNKDKAKNNKLMKISIEKYFSGSVSSSTHWEVVREYDADVQIDEILPFKDYMAIFGREDGLQRVWLTTTEVSGG